MTSTVATLLLAIVEEARFSLRSMFAATAAPWSAAGVSVFIDALRLVVTPNQPSWALVMSHILTLCYGCYFYFDMNTVYTCTFLSSL